MAAKATEEQKEFARLLYMQGEQQKVIAEKVGVSKQTVNRWVTECGWAEKRAAKVISRPELVNKTLKSIDKIIENSLDDPHAEINGDQLAKLAAAIKTLDKDKISVMEVMEAFETFGKWLNKRAIVDPTVTPQLIKEVNRLQDACVTELLSTGIE